MENPFTKWMKRHQKDDVQRNVDLADVPPEHPDQYPARHLKERLDQRRDEFDEIEGGHKGMPEGPGRY
jgi:hypothetical protein